MFYDYKNLGITDELNQARRCIINNFHATIPAERILITLSNIDDLLSKLIHYDVDEVIDDIHDLRSSIKDMIGFEKVIKVDVDKVKN